MATLDATSLNAAADAVAGIAAKLALHTGDPGSGAANEVVGGDYARVDVTWDPATGGIAALTSELVIPCPAVDVPWASLWSTDGLTRYGKAQLKSGGVATPAQFPVAGNLRISAASLTFTS